MNLTLLDDADVKVVYDTVTAGLWAVQPGLADKNKTTRCCYAPRYYVMIAHSWRQPFNKSKFRNFFQQIRTGWSEQQIGQ